MRKQDPRAFLNSKSVIYLTPLPSFLEWVELHKLSYIELSSKIDFYEENNPTVWFIPEISTFSDYKELEKYLHNLKPHLLRSEVESIYKGMDSFSFTFSADLFDKFFKINVLDNLALIEELQK